MDIEDGTELIIKAFEKREEEKAFQLYTVKYSMMDEKSFIPFNEFYNPKTQHRFEDKPVDEILAEVKVLMDSFDGGEEYRDI